MTEKLPSTEVQPSEYTGISQATIDTVKNMVFKGATNDELRMYFHKCLACGVHPLDGLIIPSKFNDGDSGGKSVVFITTVDYFRSSANDSGEYDGQDEPDFSGIVEIDGPNGKIEVPEECRVSVYRKGVSRPTIGVAKWSEFFPAQAKKQFMWKKMPRVMLAKCAEAQALRKAFPKKLHGLYAAEEMDQAVNIALAAPGGKPDVKQPTRGKPAQQQRQSSADERPTESQIKEFKLISEKQAYRLQKMADKAGVSTASICNKLKLTSLFWITWSDRAKGNYEAVCRAVEEKPKSFARYEAKAEQAPPPAQEEPGDADSFEQTAMAVAFQAGYTTDAVISEVLQENFDVESLSDVPPTRMQEVIDFFTEKGATGE